VSLNMRITPFSFCIDDNGNLSDGTPHMQAIYDAFNDQEIACNTPVRTIL
jgi:hypothetical protein